MLYSRKLLKIHFKIQYITKMSEPRVLMMSILLIEFYNLYQYGVCHELSWLGAGELGTSLVLYMLQKLWSL